jgi:hypothetical protein
MMAFYLERQVDGDAKFLTPQAEAVIFGKAWD